MSVCMTVDMSVLKLTFIPSVSVKIDKGKVAI